MCVGGGGGGVMLLPAANDVIILKTNATRVTKNKSQKMEKYRQNFSLLSGILLTSMFRLQERFARRFNSSSFCCYYVVSDVC